MKQYLDKAGRSAGKTRKPFSVRSSTLLSILCAFALVFAACDTGTGSDETSSSSTSTVSRTADSITLLTKNLIVTTSDGPQTLQATVNPATARAKLTWTSDNNEIATVLAGDEGTATVTLKNPGTANITVTTDNGRSDTCVVTIKTVKSFSVVGGYQEWYDPNEGFNYTYNNGTNQGKLILDVIYTDNTAQKVLVEPTTSNIRLPLGFENISGANTTSGPYSTTNPITNTGGSIEASEVKTVEVIYGGVKQNFTVTVRSPRIITVVGKPKQLVYGVGETFNPDGLTLTAIYNVGPNKTGIKFPEDIGIMPSNWNTADNVGKVRIDHFVYKGIATQSSTNIASVNGQAGIYDGTPSATNNPLGIDDGVQLAFWVAKVEATGGLYCGDALTTTFHELVAWAKGKKVTITIYNTTTGERTAAGSVPFRQKSTIQNITSIVLDAPGTDLTVVGKGGVQRIGWYNAGQDVATVFHVSNGAKLTLGMDITVNASLGGNIPPMVVVKGEKSEFTMEDGSTLTGMRTNLRENIAPLVVQDGAVATMKTGARIVGNTTDLGNAGATFTAAAGVLVQVGGKLIMKGGTVSGASALGDVTVYGDLEIGGDASIGRLFLVTPQGRYSKPVEIKNTWIPTNNITLYMGAQSVINGSGVSGDSMFVGQKLFTGDGATNGSMSKIVGLEAGSASNNVTNIFISNAGSPLGQWLAADYSLDAYTPTGGTAVPAGVLHE